MRFVRIRFFNETNFFFSFFSFVQFASKRAAGVERLEGKRLSRKDDDRGKERYERFDVIFIDDAETFQRRKRLSRTEITKK